MDDMKSKREEHIKYLLSKNPDLKFSHVYKYDKVTGETGFSPHKKFSELTDEEKEQVDNREILDEEVVLDIDLNAKEKKKYTNAFGEISEEGVRKIERRVAETREALQDRGYPYKFWGANGRSNHFIIVVPDLKKFNPEHRKKLKSSLIESLELSDKWVDPSKIHQNMMVSLEYTKHYKSGNLKVLIESFGEDHLREIPEDVMDVLNEVKEIKVLQPVPLRRLDRNLLDEENVSKHISQYGLPDGLQRGMTALKNIACLSVQCGHTREECGAYFSSRLAKGLPGKTVQEFLGWVDKALSQGYRFNVWEMKKWINETANPQLKEMGLPLIEDYSTKFICKIIGVDETEHWVIAEAILKDWSFVTLEGSDEIFYYEGGVYKKYGKEKIEWLCNEITDKKIKANKREEVIKSIRIDTRKPPTVINSGYINLQNGLLNPETGEFREHTPDIFSLSQLPITYDPDANCPVFKQLIDEKVSKEVGLTVQEMFGYCLLSSSRYGKFFVLTGPTHTGKSTTLNVLGELLGKDNCSAQTLQMLADDHFAPAYLYGKVANICTDISGVQSLKNTNIIKMIVVGDSLEFGKKGGHFIKFYPVTKLVFSCNDLPSLVQKGGIGPDLAFYERVTPLPFLVEHKKTDEFMPEKLREEMSGILNWALEGLKRLTEKGKFTYSPSREEVKVWWESNANPIQTFVFHYIDTEAFGMEKAVAKTEVYDLYRRYCRKIKKNPVSVEAFGREFIGITRCKPNASVYGYTAYGNIALKNSTAELRDVLLPFELRAETEGKCDNSLDNWFNKGESYEN